MIRDERIQWGLGDFEVSKKSKKSFAEVMERALPVAIWSDFPKDVSKPNGKMKKIKLRPYQVQNIVCSKLEITFNYDGSADSVISGCPK